MTRAVHGGERSERNEDETALDWTLADVIACALVLAAPDCYRLRRLSRRYRSRTRAHRRPRVATFEFSSSSRGSRRFCSATPAETARAHSIVRTARRPASTPRRQPARDEPEVTERPRVRPSRECRALVGDGRSMRPPTAPAGRTRTSG